MLQWLPGSPVQSCPDPACWIGLAGHLLQHTTQLVTVKQATFSISRNGGRYHKQGNTLYNHPSKVDMCHCVLCTPCVHVYVRNVQDTLPADTDEFAVSVLVRTSMEEAGRPREAAIARGGTNNTTHHKTFSITITGHEVLVYSYEYKKVA